MQWEQDFIVHKTNTAAEQEKLQDGTGGQQVAGTA